MNKNNFSNAMSYIDDEFIMEARTPVKKKFNIRPSVLSSVAAAVCLVMVLTVYLAIGNKKDGITLSIGNKSVSGNGITYVIKDEGASMQRTSSEITVPVKIDFKGENAKISTSEYSEVDGLRYVIIDGNMTVDWVMNIDRETSFTLMVTTEESEYTIKAEYNSENNTVEIEKIK